MIINVKENLRICKRDEYNWTVEQFKEVVKDKETKRTEKEWCVYPNFYVSSLKKAIQKCVEIQVQDNFKQEFSSVDEYLKHEENILKSIEKNIKNK